MLSRTDTLVLFKRYANHRYLHSFPTRRSSDLEAADGFNVLPPYFPGAFADFVDLVVPELQARGLFRRSEEHTSELQSLTNLVCRLLLEKKKAANCSTCHNPTLWTNVVFNHDAT